MEHTLGEPRHSAGQELAQKDREYGDDEQREQPDQRVGPRIPTIRRLLAHRQPPLNIGDSQAQAVLPDFSSSSSRLMVSIR
jgi:hypothetical protein